jgi:hypothetical protein
MSRKLMLALSGVSALAIFGAVTMPASATVYHTDPQQLVTVGKVTLPASMAPVRETVHMRSAGRVTSSGRFVENGKTRVWVPEAQAAETTPSRVTDTSESTTTQKGRFIHQGKAIVWVSE